MLLQSKTIRGTRCSSAAPDNNRNNNNQKGETPQVLKIAVSGVTELLRLLSSFHKTTRLNGVSDKGRDEFSVSGIDEVVMILKSDYENAYFATGRDPLMTSREMPHATGREEPSDRSLFHRVENSEENHDLSSPDLSEDLETMEPEDDMVVTGNDNEEMQNLQKLLGSEFEMKELGIFTSAIYAEDCIFEDPTIRFRGKELYSRNLKLLVPFFESPSIGLEKIEKGINSEASFVLATWKLRTYLKLPWRPVISIDGSTVYDLDDKFKIVRHAESWNVSAIEAIGQLFTPSYGRSNN
ncbi:hypothetical protein ACE6H2_022366 [Prunus campanulata]